MSGRRLRLQAKPNLKPVARLPQTVEELKGGSEETQQISTDVSSQEEEPPKNLSQTAAAPDGSEKILSPQKEVENNSIEISIEISPNEKSKKSIITNHPVSKLKLLSPKLNENAEILPPVPVKPVAIKLLSPKKQALEAAQAKETGVSVSVVQAPSSEAKTSKADQTPQSKTKRRRISDTHELDRAAFTMKDLIYWNPLNGTALKYDDEPSTSIPINAGSSKKTSSKANDVAAAQPAAPQIRVNPDGTLVIDETSLTITQTRQTTDFETVCETNRSRTTKLNQYSFRRNPVLKSRAWNETDTQKFYRILKMTGTDFSLMAEYFPRRCRSGLKNKFNKECKDNPDKIYTAMTKGSCALRVPRRLKKIEKEKRSKVEGDGKGNEEDFHSPSNELGSDEGIADAEHHSGSESDEIVVSKTTFEKPTRSGRIPKPSKKAEIQVKHYKSYNKSRIAKRKKLLLEHFTSDDDDYPGEPRRHLPKVVIKEMPKTSLPVDDGSAPGPSAFPRYVPGSQSGAQTVLETGNKQILLVREKAKEAGQPDLVHIYMVDPASTDPSNQNEDADIDHQQQQLIIHNNTAKPFVTAADQHLTESDHEDDIIEIDL